MAKYFPPAVLKEMNAARVEMFKQRNIIYQKYKVDLLDTTDSLSALSIHEIVSQLDPHYNINFARGGEDAISNQILIEQKAARVEGALTPTGKPRKNAGTDAAWQFHAMGDIKADRFILAARNKDDLEVKRIYDISNAANTQKIADHLLLKRNTWLNKGVEDKSKMKRDAIAIDEKTILAIIKFKSSKTVNGCQVMKD